MAVNPWAPQPAAMTWGDGYDWLRRTRATPQPAAPGTAPYALPDTVNDPWKTPGGGWDTGPGNWHWAQQSQGTTDPLAQFGQAGVDAAKQSVQTVGTADPLAQFGQSAVNAAKQGVQTVGTAAQQAAAAAGKNGQTNGTNAAKTGTAGRTGATYAKFLAAHPDFDPWTNGDSYWGAGGGNDPIIAQAFGWTNQWARDNNYGDGSRIPLAQRQQVFLANLERARQQWADNANNPEARQGVTWETSAASRIPNEGWYYEAGSGLTGKPVTQAPTTTTPITQGMNDAANGITNGNGQGGTTVADPMGSGLATGAVSASNASQPQTGTSPLLTQTLADPKNRLQQLMTALGFGGAGDEFGLLGGVAKQLAGNLYDPWSTTQGLTGSRLTNDTMGLINAFAQMMRSQGGMGQIRSDANTARSLVGNGGLNGPIDDTEMAGLLGTFNDLGNYGANPYVAEASSNLYDTGINQWRQKNIDIAGNPSSSKDNQIRLLQFLANDPTYRFAVGR